MEIEQSNMSFLAECTFYDLKQMLERKKVKSWLKSVSAFANTEGGSLFFGVDDSHTVVGLQDVQSDADFISECINDKLDPVPKYQLLPLRVEGKPVLELRIQDLTAALPTYTDSKLPTFASDGFTFYTTVGNVNYDPNKVDDTQDILGNDLKNGPKGIKWPEKWPEKALQICEAVMENSTISIPQLESLLGIGHTTIKKIIKEMQTEGLIRRVGPDKGGYWEIINN